MQAVNSPRISITFLLIIALFCTFSVNTLAQSKPQKPETPKDKQKKNQRPDNRTEEEKKQAEEEKNAVQDKDVLKIETSVVNVDAVVYNKKSGQIITGLKKENFAVFENGVKQDITNFATPEAPITITLVVDYSRLAASIGYYGSRGMDPGKMEMIRPLAYFLSRFIKPPDDYASVIAYDIRPTPLVDFTNDPQRINAVINLLLRNNPAFNESNLFDALKLALVGGRADSIVLEDTKESTMDYAGMVNLKAKRRAIILVSTGIDSMSRINYDETRKIIQSAGIPIYIIGTGEMFLKLYDQQLEPTDSISGFPGRLTFLQAKNTLNTFAKESGGMYFPVTFPTELPTVLSSINNLLRNQYSLAYDAGQKPRDGKKYKLEVKVDVDGDGVYEEKGYAVQHRPFYNAPKDSNKKEK